MPRSSKPPRSAARDRGAAARPEAPDPDAAGSGDDALDAYRRKRDPGRTPEPFGGADPGAAAAPRRVSGPPAFVVHKHAARNLHYDLRLELDGTLKSWAVPRGPSSRAEEKRLAMHVEDHPLEYGGFEGVIPAANYGAGSVIIWDRGWYRSFKPEPLLEQFQRGKLELELFGCKLRGRWTLVRMGGKQQEWLLLKKVGAGVSEQELIERYPRSVVSGVTVEEMADLPGKVAAVRAQVEGLGAPRRAVSAREQKLTLATLEEKPFDRPDWLFEIKYDGVRVLAGRRGATVELFGRSGQDITRRYPEIAEALLALPYDDFVLDGEIVAHDDAGQPSFQRLQSRMHLTHPHDIARARVDTPVTAFCFDCLALLGHDLRKTPLVDRKALLETILPPLGAVRSSGHVMAQGIRFFEACDGMRLEGMVAKRAASLYTGTRTRDWVKIKCQRRQEFVIGGWTDPQGSRGRFGALQVGLYERTPHPDVPPKLVYVTAVGTGFDGKTIEAVWEQLGPLARATSPFAGRSPAGKGHHWVEPRLVCEVRYTEWTREGGLRHPTFLGMRDDKPPEECVREEPASAATDAGDADPDLEATGADSPAPPDPPAAAPRARARSRAKPAAAADPEPAPRTALTNLGKIFWPSEAYTKGDLVSYYDAIAPHILPYLRNRPVFLTRFPDGIEGKSFYQKDAPVFVPDWVRTENVASSDGSPGNRFFVIDDAESLRYIANLGTIPIHMWSSRIGTVEHPDWTILDLDPKGAPFAHVVQVARTLKRILDDLELPSFPKTSGASGLHVLVPLGARYTYEQSRVFARLIATLVVQELPEISTIVRHVQSRGGKVYVDWGQNGHGQSIVSPFCVRAVPGASVSCPLDWAEVDDRLSPAAYTIRTVPERFAKRSDPMLGVLGPGIDMIEALRRIETLGR